MSFTTKALQSVHWGLNVKDFNETVSSQLMKFEVRLSRHLASEFKPLRTKATASGISKLKHFE